MCSTPGLNYFIRSLSTRQQAAARPHTTCLSTVVRPPTHMTDKNIRELLGPTFNINAYENKAAVFRQLKNDIGRRVPEPSARNH